MILYKMDGPVKTSIVSVMATLIQPLLSSSLRLKNSLGVSQMTNGRLQVGVLKVKVHLSSHFI